MPRICRLFIVLTMMIGVLFSIQCHAKRMMAEPVTPVIINDTTYSPAFYSGLNDKAIPGGAYVEAYDNKTQKLLWRKQIYKIKYHHDLEYDVQDIYITKISVKNGNLIIHNEKGDEYLFNVTTHAVKLITTLHP
jgi:hypothetical protein